MKLMVSAEPKVKAAFGRALDITRGELVPGESELYLIQLENGPSASSLSGLDLVLTKAKEVITPIVMVSNKSRSALANDLRWQAAMGYPNVGFIEFKNLNKVAAIIPSLIRQTRPRDTIALKALEFLSKQRQFEQLGVELAEARGDSTRYTLWLDLAKNLLGDMSEKEILRLIQNNSKGQQGLFKGKYLPGVYIDIYHVLFQAGMVSSYLVEVIRGLADTYPITLWFEGELDSKHVNDIRKSGLFFKILPKELFWGATVEIVYDDLSPGNFERVSKVKTQFYRRVI